MDITKASAIELGLYAAIRADGIGLTLNPTFTQQLLQMTPRRLQWNAILVQIVTTVERLKTLGPCLILLVCGFAAIAAKQAMPGESERVAVIAPRADLLHIVASAGGYALATTGGGIVALSTEPGFGSRLYDSGAWLVLRFDGPLGCLNSNLEDSENERG